MRLELRVSGGVAGVRRPPVTLDTTTLPPAEAAEVEALAERVAAQPPPPGPAGPDRFQYDLRIDDRELRLHEGALTPEASDLLARLGR
jgi:Emfourin